MQELERMINIYHTAFLIFLILTIVFLFVSVFLFFKFDIRGIFDLRSGRGARKTIQKMQELNDQTGKLRESPVTATPAGLSGEERIAAPPTEKKDASSHEEDSQQTELLSQQCGQRDTVCEAVDETTLLSSGQMQDISQPEKRKLPGMFKIEKEIMWVHTEEVL